MTVQVDDAGVIELKGRCAAGDAELLLQRLLAAPGSSVEWSSCEHLHSAVLQVLLAARPPMRGTPTNSFLATHVAPVLPRAAAAAPRDRIDT
jgi:hypothetical protein